jgi:hypothetical protein
MILSPFFFSRTGKYSQLKAEGFCGTYARMWKKEWRFAYENRHYLWS